MLKYGYITMILFTIIGSFWLEIFLKIGVLRRAKRLVLSILPVSLFFLAWDAYAIDQGHWYFDRAQILGIIGPFDIPLEEFLFFTFIPIAAVMTIEAVRIVKKHWPVGDE
jgi:lycopene cyclase domain-containing protein